MQQGWCAVLLQTMGWHKQEEGRQDPRRKNLGSDAEH